uniref:Cytochrome P450 n=1 Tax=Anopheles culicifacies TaxID=139723 RepID=A0A182M0N6_9DIPT
MLLFVFLVTVALWGVLRMYQQRQQLWKIASRFSSPQPHWLLGQLPLFPANDIPGIFETMRRGPYDYIPFSIGSRNCIGQRYALMEMKITIIKMLAHYRILPGETMPQVRLKTDLVLRPDKGIPIKIQRRL